MQRRFFAFTEWLHYYSHELNGLAVLVFFVGVALAFGFLVMFPADDGLVSAPGEPPPSSVSATPSTTIPVAPAPTSGTGSANPSSCDRPVRRDQSADIEAGDATEDRSIVEIDADRVRAANRRGRQPFASGTTNGGSTTGNGTTADGTTSSGRHPASGTSSARHPASGASPARHPAPGASPARHPAPGASSGPRYSSVSPRAPDGHWLGIVCPGCLRNP